MNGGLARRRRALPAVLLPLALSACTGEIGARGVGSSGGSVPTTPAATCARPGRSAIRRLTKTELMNTVRDLFDVDPAPLVAIPDEQLGASGFDTDAQTIDVSSQLLDQYLTAIEPVAAAVIAHPGFLTCQPGAQLSGSACAQQVLAAQLPRIFRRPVTADDTADLMAVYSTNEPDGFTTAMQLVLQAALASPSFLYRTYHQAAASGPGQIYALDDYELASQLAYFLWSSTPDAELLARAKAGELSQPAVLEAQARRMLADPKGLALIDAFGAQWLGLSQLPTATRDQTLYPAWTPELRAAMIDETQMFLRAILTQDRSPLELLTADYTYLDARLAQHYGVPGVTGALHKVSLPPDSHRVGLLTQGSFLALTSTSERSNPIRRGRWVLLQALCAELPPRPANIMPLPDTGAAEGNVRDELAAHRTNPSCSGCHSMMDPIGLSLESFDAIGHYRTTYRDGSSIDPTGKLPGGTTFTDVRGLVNALVDGGDFHRCVTRRLLSYAVSRNLTPDDQCVADRIAAASVSPDRGLSDLVTAIVASPPFTKREGSAP